MTDIDHTAGDTARGNACQTGRQGCMGPRGEGANESMSGDLPVDPQPLVESSNRKAHHSPVPALAQSKRKHYAARGVSGTVRAFNPAKIILPSPLLPATHSASRVP